MSRPTSTLKQNPARKPPSPPPSPHAALTFSHSHSFLSHSFNLSLLSSKVVALFHSLPWARGEQCKHTLPPWILVRNRIRPSYSPYSFLTFSFLSHSLSARGRWGELKQARCKGKLFSALSFLFSRHSFFLPRLCKHKHLLSIKREGQKKWEWMRLFLTKGIIIDCKLRNISKLNHCPILHFCPYWVCFTCCLFPSRKQTQ